MNQLINFKLKLAKNNFEYWVRIANECAKDTARGINDQNLINEIMAIKQGLWEQIQNLEKDLLRIENETKR